MSAQTRASEHWAAGRHFGSIAKLREAALDYSFPAGQAQAGIQLASVEIPWLLAENARLKEQITNGSRQDPPQTLAALA